MADQSTPQGAIDTSFYTKAGDPSQQNHLFDLLRQYLAMHAAQNGHLYQMNGVPGYGDYAGLYHPMMNMLLGSAVGPGQTGGIPHNPFNGLGGQASNYYSDFGSGNAFDALNSGAPFAGYSGDY